MTYKLKTIMKQTLQTLNQFLTKKVLVGSMLAIGSAMTAQVSVMDVIDGSPLHTTLRDAIDATGSPTANLPGTSLRAGLSNLNSSLTVFAPTNAAFEALPAGTLEAYLGSRQGLFNLRQILRFHVMGGEVSTQDFVNGDYITTFVGDSIITTVTGFDEVFINQSPVTAGLTDVQAANGILHSLDQVLFPGNTLVDLAIQSGYTTLATALIAAELVPALVDPASDLTVFAPTNAAFEALDPALLADLLADPTGDLRDILLFHVLGMNLPSSDITDGLIASTLLASDDVTFTFEGTNILIEESTITNTDLMADNGIIHEINAVMIPEELTTGLFNNSEVNSALAVYPNPVANSNLFIDTDLKANYLVLDASGRVVAQGTYSTAGIDVANLSEGVYSIQVVSNNSTFSSTFVK